MIQNEQTYTDETVELTSEMTEEFKAQQLYMLKLLHRTLSVAWEHDPEMRDRIEKLSHILAASRWARSRRHAS